MRYRRRFFIPIFHNGQQIAHLQWTDGGMEAWIADGTFVGKYPTRKEAASALWKELRKHNRLRGGWTTRA
jgi:hypothetical protein